MSDDNVIDFPRVGLRPPVDRTTPPTAQPAPAPQERPAFPQLRARTRTAPPAALTPAAAEPAESAPVPAAEAAENPGGGVGSLSVLTLSALTIAALRGALGFAGWMSSRSKAEDAAKKTDRTTSPRNTKTPREKNTKSPSSPRNQKPGSGGGGGGRKNPVGPNRPPAKNQRTNTGPKNPRTNKENPPKRNQRSGADWKKSPKTKGPKNRLNKDRKNPFVPSQRNKNNTNRRTDNLTPKKPGPTNKPKKTDSGGRRNNRPFTPPKNSKPPLWKDKPRKQGPKNTKPSSGSGGSGSGWKDKPKKKGPKNTGSFTPPKNSKPPLWKDKPKKKGPKNSGPSSGSGGWKDKPKKKGPKHEPTDRPYPKSRSKKGGWKPPRTTPFLWKDPGTSKSGSGRGSKGRTGPGEYKESKGSPKGSESSSESFVPPRGRWTPPRRPPGMNTETTVTLTRIYPTQPPAATPDAALPPTGAPMPALPPAPSTPTVSVDSDLTITDLVDADADAAIEILDRVDEAHTVATACEQLVQHLEELKMRITELAIPGSLADSADRLLDQATAVKAHADALASTLPRASEAIQTAGANAAARHKQLSDTTKDHGHAAPAHADYHKE